MITAFDLGNGIKKNAIYGLNLSQWQMLKGVVEKLKNEIPPKAVIRPGTLPKNKIVPNDWAIPPKATRNVRPNVSKEKLGIGALSASMEPSVSEAETLGKSIPPVTEKEPNIGALNSSMEHEVPTGTKSTTEPSMMGDIGSGTQRLLNALTGKYKWGDKALRSAGNVNTLGGYGLGAGLASLYSMGQPPEQAPYGMPQVAPMPRMM